MVSLGLKVNIYKYFIIVNYTELLKKSFCVKIVYALEKPLFLKKKKYLQSFKYRLFKEINYPLIKTILGTICNTISYHFNNSELFIHPLQKVRYST